MAQNMKLSIITPAGDRIVITLNENETFREFQSKVLQEHNFSFDIGNFIFESSSLLSDDNLYDYLKNYVNTDEDGNIVISDQPLFEIDLTDNTEVETTVKSESSQYVLHENSLENTAENFYADSSLMVMNQDQNGEFNHVLSENIFESTYQQETNKTNSDITLYGVDDSVLITNEYQLIETNSLEKDVTHQEKIDVTTIKESPGNNSLKDDQNDQSYNYMDIETKLREIHDYNEDVLADFCRLCAGSVKEKTTIAITCDKLEEMVNFALPIKIASEDGLPQQLCESCVERMKICYDFVNIVQGADKILRLKFMSSQTSDQNCQESSATEFMTDFLSSPSNKVNFEEEQQIKEKQETPDYNEIEYLNLQRTENNSEPAINCRICDLVLDTVEHAIIHSTNEHLIDDLYACPLCEYGFITQSEHKEHISSDHQIRFELLNTRKLRGFQCSVCSKKYSSQIQLEKHTCATVTTNKTLHCEICNQSFPTKVRLNFHRQFHLKDARPLYCAMCNITFDDENEFFDHVNFKHESKQVFPCGICGKTFSIRSALNDHKKQHKESRTHECNICLKSFLDRQTLREHEVGHMTTTPYQCHICGKNLNRLSRLKRHLLTHESNPVLNNVHNCNLCKEVFANNHIADIHQSSQHENTHCIQIISTDKVFRCEFCEKCYSSPTALNDHRICHSGLTPYTCHICKAQFSTYSRCISHKTTHGLYKDGAEKDSFPVVKHFLCEQCGKSHLHWSYLNLHRRLKHSENAHTYKCNECNIECPTSWAIAYHRKTKHNQDQCKCEDCGKILSNQQSLKLHRLTQHSNKRANDFRCDKCGKIFVQQSSLDAHLKLHQGIRDFKCILCPKSFVHPSGLSSHIKLHQSQKLNPSNSRSILRSGLKLADEVYTKTNNTERPYTCNECGLSFKRLFTLKNHTLKHNQTPDTSSFVLMVDMKEDCNVENDDSTPRTQPAQLIPQDNGTQDNIYVQYEPVTDSSTNYIDIGHGNYLQVMGNTLNIVGADDKITNTNHAFEMIVDETLREEEPVIAGNLAIEQQYENNTVMLVNSENSSYILKQDEVQPQYVFTTMEKTLQKAATTYVIGNEFMLEADDQTF